MAAPAAPAAQLGEAVAAAAAMLPAHAPTAGYHPYGIPELRQAVAARFTRRGLPTLPDQILITTGSQHAISLILALLGRPGDRVLVENPSYPNALDAIRRAGLRAAPVPVTDAGWDTALVESTLRQAAPRIAYLVPDFQNPTGALMAREQRVRILETARATGTWLLIDETVADIALDVPSPPPFASLAPHGVAEQVVTVGSLSKSHWGGLRIGWVRAGSRLITELAMARIPSDMATPVLEQLVALHLMGGIDEVLGERLPRLRASRDALAAALTRQLPEWRWVLPPGGLSLWVDLGAPIASSLARAALGHGVRIEGGSRFGADPGTHEHRLRIPFTLAPELYEEAAARLAAALPPAWPPRSPPARTRRAGPTRATPTGWPDSAPPPPALRPAAARADPPPGAARPPHAREPPHHPGCGGSPDSPNISTAPRTPARAPARALTEPIELATSSRERRRRRGSGSPVAAIAASAANSSSAIARSGNSPGYAAS
ncbi:putative 2-aminoadipate transaminase [Streptomyces aurantiacus JA 4570]|uniref:Putative 2-aminoadipate transaminase n=1 Tax=Streptomyces aurantiacus JA 4570 TaxID=1286094 RepID=S3ZSK0_9ACTN|nr:putative 2-aminoadipate transaminase [Streptomyces aurantiacus JA 4570]